MILLVSGILLSFLAYANPVPLALVISVFSTATLGLSLKALRGSNSKRTKSQCSEIIAFSNFPRPMLFTLEKGGTPVAYTRDREIKRKDLLEDLRSKLLSFPFSIEMKVSCPITHFVRHIMTPEISKRVAVLVYSSKEWLTILSCSNEVEALYDFTYKTSQLAKSKNFARCYTSHTLASELINTCKGYSPPLKLSYLRIPAGVTSGRWLVVSETRDFERMTKDFVQPSFRSLFHIKFERRRRGFISTASKRFVSLLSSITAVVGPQPLKFNLLFSQVPNRQEYQGWDLILEQNEVVPEDIGCYDGILFLRPASEDEVIKLLPAPLSYLSKSLNGKTLAFELKSRTPLALVGDSHGGT